MFKLFQLKRRQTKDAAHRILDGIIEIVENEQLIHGDYVTDVVNKELRGKAICGGRQACLLGSAALAANLPKGELFSRWSSTWQHAITTKPSLALACEALDNEALARMKRDGYTDYEFSQQSGGRLAEHYFESYLPIKYGQGAYDDEVDVTATRARTNRSIISLCNAAKRRIEA